MLARTAGLFLALLLGCSAIAEPGAVIENGAAPRERAGQGLTPLPPVPLSDPEPTAPSVEPPTKHRFLKGQTHVHTGRSYDARTPPDEVLRFYADRGYDFVAITDHNRITVVEPPEGLLLIPGVELTQNSAACNPPPPGGYRCLFHTTALFVDPSRDRARGKRFRIPYEPRRVRAYTSQIGLTAELGGIPVLNHPLFHFAADAKTVHTLVDSELLLVELFNASVDRMHPAGRERAEQRSERLWDEVLSGGSLVYAIATDDSHHFSDAAKRRKRGKFAYDGDQAWIMVASEKSPSAIRRALISGDFYATSGILLDALERTPSGLRLEIAAASAEGAVTRFIGSGGKELATSSDRVASYAPRGDEGYVRAVVRRPDGKKAWTQPLWLAP